MVRRYVQLAGKAARHPGRALLRLVLMHRLRRTSLWEDRARLLHLVSLTWGVDGPALLAEYRRSPFAGWYREQVSRLGARSGGRRWGTSDEFSLEALYLLVRAARPRVMVETGVLYGAASGHILAAMAANGEGVLHSIDLGCGPGEPSHHDLVPPELLAHWTYHEGDVRQVLPPLLDSLGEIDFFHHDSLHTFDHMTWEYRQASAYLARGGVLSSHDVLVADGLGGIFRENAFPHFCRRRDLPHFLVRNLGVALVTRSADDRVKERSTAAARERHAPSGRPADAGVGLAGAMSMGNRG